MAVRRKECAELTGPRREGGGNLLSLSSTDVSKQDSCSDKLHCESSESLSALQDGDT